MRPDTALHGTRPARARSGARRRRSGCAHPGNRYRIRRQGYASKPLQKRSPPRWCMPGPSGFRGCRGRRSPYPFGPRAGPDRAAGRRGRCRRRSPAREIGAESSRQQVAAAVCGNDEVRFALHHAGGDRHGAGVVGEHLVDDEIHAAGVESRPAGLVADRIGGRDAARVPGVDHHSGTDGIVRERAGSGFRNRLLSASPPSWCRSWPLTPLPAIRQLRSSSQRSTPRTRRPPGLPRRFVRWAWRLPSVRTRRADRMRVRAAGTARAPARSCPARELAAGQRPRAHVDRVERKRGRTWHEARCGSGHVATSSGSCGPRQRRLVAQGLLSRRRRAPHRRPAQVRRAGAGARAR